MAESDELLRGVKKLEAVQQYHSHVLELLLRVQDQERLLDDILPLLSRPQVFRVFLAVDGASSGVDIAAKTHVPQRTVSRYLTSLEEHGLIQLVTTGAAKIYAKTAMFNLLHLPKELTDQYAATRRRPRRKGT